MKNNNIKSYDLSLGRWGPYNKKYLGISHIDNEKIGSVFCVELFPGYYRRSVVVSPTVCDGAVKMWGANARLDSFCYRYELEWKDRVYCDVHFNITGDSRVDIDCEFVNNTENMQNLSMNLCAGMRMSKTRIIKADGGEGCLVIDAVDYDEIRGNFGIAQDGKYLGETEADGASGFGTAVKCGERVSVGYKPVKAADSVGIRFSSATGDKLNVTVNDEQFTICAETCGFEYHVVHFEPRTVEKIEITAGQEAFIDCLTVGFGVEKCTFEEREASFEPLERDVTDSGIILKYSYSDFKYKILWDAEPLAVRQLFAEDEGLLLQKYIHNHTGKRFRARNDSGAWENVFAKPMYLAPHETSYMRFTVMSAECETGAGAAAGVSNHLYSIKHNPDGERYVFSQNMMAYTTLLNVVYPIYSRRGYIRHNTPGRNWDSLYSWDSGFIGMGLGTIDFDRAFDCLNSYLTPVGDIHSPYIFHGSVVPTQVFLYAELSDRFPEERERLKKLYPMMKQYYGFYSSLCGDGHQTGSGLLKTWHIFYNSGGWDDYPPQTAVHANSRNGIRGNTSDTTPVITTACVVLIAKIMKRLAELYGDTEIECFDADIKKYSDAIQKYLWDDEMGYYSYMIHDEDGTPREFLRYSDGTNYNCGFDGIYPYIAGISDCRQRKRIIGNIKNGLMTEYGVGTVDTRVPYYSDSGYWNGSVWMPHQWILWKSLLDTGETELATEIAQKAIKTWADEVNDSYSCFENFTVRSGRGSGYHAFSGLSTPVLMFYEALYCPGSVATGFFTSVKEKRFSEDNNALELTVDTLNDTSAVLVCMNSEFDYKFSVGGKYLSAQKVTGGAYFVKPRRYGESVILAERQ